MHSLILLYMGKICFFYKQAIIFGLFAQRVWHYLYILLWLLAVKVICPLGENKDNLDFYGIVKKHLYFWQCRPKMY